MTHYDLCKLTAERYIKNSNVALYDYQYITGCEFPDVLVFNSGYTVLYEIKISRSDFIVDAKKDSRIKFKMNNFLSNIKIKRDRIITYSLNHPELMRFVVECPHLGLQRYYVCPPGLIDENEIGEWGLIYYKNHKFYTQKKSSQFIRNIHAEISILVHAMRKYANGITDNILINKYKR